MQSTIQTDSCSNPGERTIWQLVARWLAGEANASDLLELYTRSQQDAELLNSIKRLETIWHVPPQSDTGREKAERLLLHRIKQRCIYLAG